MTAIIQKDSTGNIAVVRILNPEGDPWTGVAYNETGLAIYYTPKGGTPVPITLSSGNWTETVHGEYEVVIPDAAYTQTAQLQITGAITNGVVIPDTHLIVERDPLAAGVKLAADGLDLIPTTAPAGVAITFREMVVAVWRDVYKKVVKSGTDIKHYADNGTDELTVQPITEEADVQTKGAAL